MKRWISLCLTGLLALGLVMPVGAYDTDIIGFSDIFGDGGYYMNGKSKYKSSHLDDLAYLSSITPGTEIFVPLRARDFEWSDEWEEIIISGDSVGFRGLGVDYVYEDGNPGVIESVKIEQYDGKTGVMIRFLDHLASFESVRFKFDVYVTIASQRYDDGKFRVAGSIANRYGYIYKTTTEADLGPDRYIISKGDVENVRFDLGNNVSITASLKYDDRVYGVAQVKTTEKDRQVMEQHPQISKVIKMITLGFPIGTGVQIGTEDGTVKYIYNGDNLEYLGTTEQKVMLVDTYYIADQAL